MLVSVLAFDGAVMAMDLADDPRGRHHVPSLTLSGTGALDQVRYHEGALDQVRYHEASIVVFEAP